MKNLLLTTTLLCFFAVAATAQWRIISVKPGAKVYANGKPIRKGSRISPKAKIKFTKKTDYVRVYAKGRAPFTLKPGGGKPGKSSELVAVATSMVVAKKRSLASRGGAELIDAIPNKNEGKVWLTGAPPDAKSPLKKPRKLLFIGDEGKIYVDMKVDGDFKREIKNSSGGVEKMADIMFYLVFSRNGKRGAKPLKVDVNHKENLITVSFSKNLTNFDEITKSALFYKIEEDKRPRPWSKFQPYFIDEPSDDFKTEIKDVIPLLKENYGDAFLKKVMTEKKYTKAQAEEVATEEIFYGIADLFVDAYGGMPDRNSLKMWLIKNFKGLKVPGKKE